MGNTIKRVVTALRRQARAKRARVFRSNFNITAAMRILDIGSEDGSSIATVLNSTGAHPKHVYIADIDADMVKKGEQQFGFVPVVIPESGRLPFDDGFFDIVYCSSVIEHVTVPKAEVWSITDDEKFRSRARQRQLVFAQEIRRLGKRYFVQTPNKWFPVESHTWLPFVGYLSRSWQLRVLSFSNRYWVKRTNPDWYLLTAAELRALFPDAVIEHEKFLGLTKSLMAIKR